jgi:hypothetical protein
MSEALFFMVFGQFDSDDARSGDIMIVTLMKRADTTVKLLPWLAGAVATIIVLMPFHAFLTVWLASEVGQYLLLRLWKEFLLVLLAFGALYVLVTDKPLRRRFLASRLHQLIGAYRGLSVVWGIGAYLLNSVSTKALGYGLIVNLRFLVFYLCVWTFAAKAPKLFAKWPVWLWGPLSVVVVIGMLQYFVLPYDVLRHFGYSEQTIYPYETINHNIHHLRVMATLRGANPLGAYLVVVLSVLTAMWWRRWRTRQALLLVGGLAVLFLSFSRSAWIGVVLAGIVVAAHFLNTEKLRSRAVIVGAAVVLVLAGAGMLLRGSTTLQDYLFHTNEKSTIKTSSNEGHVAALRDGIRDLVHQPLGEGVGSAGPASVYNRHPARIAENYYIQTGQEMGWLGFFAFIATQVLLAVELWRRRTQSLALGLLAALVGVSFINLLSHAWTDDTLAYLFWGLAGIALTTTPGVVKLRGPSSEHEVTR